MKIKRAHKPVEYGKVRTLVLSSYVNVLKGWFLLIVASWRHQQGDGEQQVCGWLVRMRAHTHRRMSHPLLFAGENAFYERSAATVAISRSAITERILSNNPSRRATREVKRGGCDDPNTSQWKWHTGQAWPAPPPLCSPTHACVSHGGRLTRAAGACLRDAYSHTGCACMRFVFVYLRWIVLAAERCAAQRWWGEGKAGA